MNKTDCATDTDEKGALRRRNGSQLRFRLNGRPIVLDSVDPRLLLIEYLRSPGVGCTGTKLSCGEGGCGACTVVLTQVDSSSGSIIESPINACLRPLCSLDGMVVTTVEGIGDHRNLNPIQERLVQHNASQCGFCTPGFVMCMYGMLRSNPSPSNEDVEGFFDGNLCRCTGFRPILDAMQSFVGDSAGVTSARGAPVPLDALEPPREFTVGDGTRTWRRVTSIRSALIAMRDTNGRLMRLVNGNTAAGIYKRPIDKTEIFIDISQIAELRTISLLDRGIAIGAGVTYARLLSGVDALVPSLPSYSAHGLQVFRNHVLRIAGHQVRSMGTVGGNVMLVLGHAVDGKPFPSDLFTLLTVLDAEVTVRRSSAPDNDERYSIHQFSQLPDFAENYLLIRFDVPFTLEGDWFETYKVARRAQNSHAIVNAGFLIGFDEARHITRCRIVFGGLRSIAWRAERTEEALAGRAWDEVDLNRVQGLLHDEIAALEIADFGDGLTTSYRRSLASNLFYKFLVGLRSRDDAVGSRLLDAGLPRLRPVSFGRHSTIPAPYVDTSHLAGTPTLDGIAGVIPNQPTLAEVGRPLAFYLAENRLPLGRPARRDEASAKALADALTAGVTRKIAALAPLPMAKLGAELQVSGEAKYTQDLFVPAETLAAQFVHSTRSFAKFDHSATISDLLLRLRNEFPGVRAYVTYADIPRPSPAHAYNPADPGAYDPVFANTYVTAVGQPIGLVLADCSRTANAAATRMQDFISYDTMGLNEPVLTIEQALARNSFLKDRNSISSITRPGSDTPWLDTPDPTPDEGKVLVTGKQSTGAQAHFYFETQSALAVPGEMDRMTVFCSSQNLGSCQAQVANALGLPTAKVQAKAVRVGGGFGGKEVRAPYFSVAAAVAAQKLGQPVRLALDRNTDMRMVGKRHPFQGHFIVSGDREGRIEKIKLDFVADAGSSYDCTLPVTDLVLLSADSAYNIETFRASRKACLTNKLTNTAMRSFGVIQCTLIVEEAIEKYAHRLGLSPELVRERNFYKDATIDQCDITPYGQALIDCRINQVWNDFKKVIDFDVRTEQVSAFNKAHRWRKRGISMIPIKYGISYTSMSSNQSGADILVYANDGTVIVKHGGMEMGQGIHTKIARLAADALGIDIRYIEVAGTDTSDVANAPSTGASTGTDLNGGAVWEACTKLRERLVQFCQAADPPIPNWDTQWQGQWPSIVKRAYGARVQLSSQALFKSPDLAALDEHGRLPKPQLGGQDPRIFYYFTYSAAASEVEIDVLTGEHTVLRADVVYDSGKTINSSLDYGQIEGGFIQGIGNVTCEEILFTSDGTLLSDGTWNYKVPCTKSIPVEFNVHLLDYVPSASARTPLDTYGIRSAKATGEPPLVLGATVFFAIKHAILAAREETGSSEWFELASPATVERIQTACLTRPEALKMTEA